MVKERRRHPSPSSEDSSDSSPRNRRKRERRKSPEAYHSRHHKDVKPRIKKEPVSESDSDSNSDSDTDRKPRIKHEHTGKYSRERHGERRIKQEYGENSARSHERRHEERERPVYIKQEPDSEEEMRQQREERRKHDQRRIEKRRQQDREERRGDRSRNDRPNNRDRGGNRDIPEEQRYGRQENQETANNSSAGQADKDAPNFELSGKLTEDTNTYKGVVIKYNEPPEARKPKKRWRLYPFKNDEPLKPFHMHRQSAYLFGRDRLIADIPVDHPSCSKQHAVFQYRMVPYEKPDGRRAYRIAPYIIDLESANGTFVNNKRIDDRVYVELFEKDVIKFGFSSREYVLLHDRSDTKEVESDVTP